MRLSAECLARDRMHGLSRLLSTALSLSLLASVAGCNGDDGDGSVSVIVFNGEANRLNAYDPATLEKRTVIPSARDNPQIGRDFNGQICFFPDGSRRFIGGEDTGQPDPPQGWGVFQLMGDRLGELTAEQIGKLAPTYHPPVANAENYGCGFLSDGRVLTSDVGSQATGPGTGQLIVWFPPFDRPPEEQRYCKLDVTITTAGGIWVDGQDRIYVTSARSGDTTAGGRVYRYTGPFPTSDDASGRCGRVDDTGAPLTDAVTRDIFILDPNVPTPSSIVQTPAGSFYVASVFNGVIAEYDGNGQFVRIILQPPEPGVPPFPTGTPFGLGLDSSGTLYYADIGIVVDPPRIGPGPNAGSVRRIRFENGQPLAPETLDDGLNFPDGIGVLEE
jgi:hypothetical protein